MEVLVDSLTIRGVDQRKVADKLVVALGYSKGYFSQYEGLSRFSEGMGLSARDQVVGYLPSNPNNPGLPPVRYLIQEIKSPDFLVTREVDPALGWMPGNNYRVEVNTDSIEVKNPDDVIVQLKDLDRPPFREKLRNLRRLTNTIFNDLTPQQLKAIVDSSRSWHPHL